MLLATLRKKRNVKVLPAKVLMLGVLSWVGHVLQGIGIWDSNALVVGSGALHATMLFCYMFMAPSQYSGTSYIYLAGFAPCIA